MLLSDKMEEKVQQIQLQQEISNYKDEIRDLQEKLETLKVRKGAKKAFENKFHRSEKAWYEAGSYFINRTIFEIEDL